MILVDTSIWVALFRDKSGHVQEVFHDRIRSDIYVLSRFNQLELLQGAKDSKEWMIINDYLSTQIYLEISENGWREAAKIYFDLRRIGITLNSAVDCCIAQVAIENYATLLHRDQDFELIARVRPLYQDYLP
jgi:predicted nucleic acid-binding protein